MEVLNRGTGAGVRVRSPSTSRITVRLFSGLGLRRLLTQNLLDLNTEHVSRERNDSPSSEICLLCRNEYLLMQTKECGLNLLTHEMCESSTNFLSAFCDARLSHFHSISSPFTRRKTAHESGRNMSTC